MLTSRMMTMTSSRAKKQAVTMILGVMMETTMILVGMMEGTLVETMVVMSSGDVTDVLGGECIMF